MTSLIKKYFLKIYRFAKEEGLSDYETKLLKYTIIVAIVCGIVNLAFLIINLISNNTFIALGNTIGISFFFVTIFLIQNRNFSLSKLLLIITINLILLFISSAEGRGMGNEFFWMPILVGIILIYSGKEKLYQTYAYIISFSSIIFLEFTDYSFLFVDKFSETYRMIHYYLGLISSILGVFILLYFIQKQVLKSHQKNNKTNRILQNKIRALRQANHELDGFVYKASHDLRSPLTSMLGLIQIAKEEKEISTIKEYLKLQEKSIHKLDTFIVDILNVSRNARTEVKIENINFDELIDEVLEQINYMEHFSNIKIQIDIDQKYRYASDQMRLAVVLNNILANSVRYADLQKENPFIIISVRVLNDKAHITIQDNGIGIPMEHLPKIFDMYYRVGQKNSGTGLGLYIVRETIHKLGGKVYINSKEKEGTSIDIVLPNFDAELEIQS